MVALQNQLSQEPTETQDGDPAPLSIRDQVESHKFRGAKGESFKIYERYSQERRR